MKESLTKMLGAAISFLLIGLFVVATAPAWAGSVEERINSLEKELAELKGEQLELKKDAQDALAAKKALPTFRYRRRGIRITAADKSWAWRMFSRHYVYVYNETDGNDARGRAAMDLFHRRHRVYWQLKWDDGLYDIQHGIDMDTTDAFRTQTTAFYIHFEKMNPFFPTLGIYDKGGPSAGFVARSSTSSAAVEYTRDINTDSGVDTLSHRGIGLLWNRAPLMGIGTFTFNVGFVNGAGINRNTLDASDNPQLELVLGARPFSKTKNKWLKRVKLGVNWKHDSIDSRGTAAGSRRIRLRETVRRPVRFALFQAAGIGDGDHNYFHWGVENRLGPYLIRVNGNIARYEGENDAFRGIRTYAWGVGHELFLWSPKGFLTGKAHRAGSLLFGYRFARGDADCGVPGCDARGGGSSNHYYENEWDLWYWVRPSFSVGIWVVHNNAANMRVADQIAVGCKANNSTADPGDECDWTSVNFGLRTDW